MTAAAPAAWDNDPDEILRRVVAGQLEEWLRKPTWVPLPHQVPPPGDWLGWLLLGGRGSGKSAACSKYITDHVNGPPCLPGPVPHWLGIIAPTLGDAATSCFAGPAGIRQFNPEAQLKQRAGGMVVEWPNGSQAKLYGTREPDDIERLRAGGNTSLAAGTLVETERGPVPIEDVRAGDRVWTRRGLRRVLHAGQTGIKPTCRLETEAGRVVELTADHEVWVGTWREAADLQPGDTVSTWITSPTMAFGGTDDEMATTPTRVAACCTATSGPARSDRSRTGTLCTTGIRTTRRLLTPPVSSWSAATVSTSPRVILNHWTGTGWEVRPPGATAISSIGCAPIAVATSLAVLTDMSYAAPTVARPGAPTAAGRFRVVHSRGACALCAVLSSMPPPADPPSLAPDRVQHVSLPSGNVPVYDLLVEHDHEFIANGVLVSNCMVWAEELAAWRYLEDAWDQFRFGLRVGPKPRWIASTTPKPKPLIKKLVAGAVKNVALTHATMYDNPHLPEHIRQALEEAYAGTATGAQELYGRLVEQDENALFSRDNLERNRFLVVPGWAGRNVVGVDPSGGAGEQGIVVVAAGQLRNDAKGRVEKHGLVLADRSVRLKPEGWARTAVTAAIEFESAALVVETNFGGDMAVSTLATAAEDMGVAVPIRTVHASRGKKPRAQPVSAMAVQDRWHMVGEHPELEDQICTWTEEADYSPDRMDAMVWPAWYLKLVSTVYRAVGSFGGGAMSQRSLLRR